MTLTAILLTVILTLSGYLVKLKKDLKAEREYYTGDEKETLKALENAWRKRYFKAMGLYLNFSKIDKASLEAGKFRVSGGEEKDWIAEIFKLAQKHHSFNEMNYESAKRAYNIEKDKAIDYNYKNNLDARQPYLKPQSDWTKQSIDTIALDMGLDITKKEVQDILKKMK